MAHRRIPSLNWLRVFEVAARTESFARAAEALAMSPPAVSQQIRALEAWLGRDLFERRAKSVRLTDAGRAFLPVVGHAIGSVEATAASLFGRPGAAPLVVRANALFAVGWLAPRLGRFLDAHPDIHLSLVTDLERPSLRHDDADLAITFGRPAAAAHDRSEALFGEVLTAVATPGLAARISEPADLLRHPLMEVAAHEATWFRLLPKESVWPCPPRFVYTDTTLAALSAALSGTALALARGRATAGLVDRLRLVPCLDGHSARGIERYHMTPSVRTRPAPALRLFMDWLRAELGRDDAAPDIPAPSRESRI